MASIIQPRPGCMPQAWAKDLLRHVLVAALSCALLHLMTLQHMKQHEWAEFLYQQCIQAHSARGLEIPLWTRYLRCMLLELLNFIYFCQ